MNIILILAVSAVIISVIVFATRKSGDGGKLSRPLQSLLNFVERNGEQLSQYDALANLAIGITKSGNRIYFLKIIDDRQIVSQADLVNTQKSAVVKTTRRANGDEIIETISLNFSGKEKSAPSVAFEFYNIEYDSLSVYGELELANKWQKIISDKLKDLTPVYS